MDELVRDLTDTARVLDLGAGDGSFDYSSSRALTIAVDVNFPEQVQASSVRVLAQSDALPLASNSIDVVVCNHTLEHFEKLEGAIEEVARVLPGHGYLWVAVPDGFSFDDNLYRFLFRGGGHINRFTLPDLIGRVEQDTGLRALAYKELYTGFVYLNPPSPEKIAFYPRRARVLAWIPVRLLEFSLRWLNYCVRVLDAYFSTRLSRYGWGVIFRKTEELSRIERSIEDIERLPEFVNVCFACGAGHARASLEPLLSGFFSAHAYRCPSCGKRNIYWPREPSAPRSGTG